MKKKRLFLGGLLLLAMTFSATVFTACHKDDKENEVVVDPLTEKEYYIVGTVTTANGALAGVKVDAGSNITATTDRDGIYTLTVKETGEYTLKFTATDMENFENKVTIASDAANRTQMAMNVKMVKAISFADSQEETVSADEDTKVEVAPVPSESAEEPTVKASVDVPQGAADAGTKIAAVAYEQPKAAEAEESSTATPKEEVTTLSAVAIKVTPADAVAKAPIEIKTAATGLTTTGSYFDPNSMQALKDATVSTRAAVPFGKVTYKDGSYIITIPKGETIQGKYLTNILPSKIVGKVKQEGFNTVNDKEGIIKIENRDYAALTTTLKVVTKCGWDYTTTPEVALNAAGAPAEMAAILAKSIRDAEGSKNGYYTVTKELKTAISGNNQLTFGSHCKTQEKSYTFSVFVNGEKVAVVVKLKCYVGYVEEYSNTPISQHSGGTTN